MGKHVLVNRKSMPYQHGGNIHIICHSDIWPSNIRALGYSFAQHPLLFYSILCVCVCVRCLFWVNLFTWFTCHPLEYGCLYNWISMFSGIQSMNQWNLQFEWMFTFIEFMFIFAFDIRKYFLFQFAFLSRFVYVLICIFVVAVHVLSTQSCILAFNAVIFLSFFSFRKRFFIEKTFPMFTVLPFSLSLPFVHCPADKSSWNSTKFDVIGNSRFSYFYSIRCNNK